MKYSDIKVGTVIFLKTDYPETFIIKSSRDMTEGGRLDDVPYICPSRKEYERRGYFGINLNEPRKEYRLATPEEIRWLEYCIDQGRYIPVENIKPTDYEIF